MAFRILKGEAVAAAMRRIAREQIDAGLAELEDSQLDEDKKVHQVRKRCKKLRGLIRLYRPAFKQGYELENAWFRDAARPLSGIRDAQSQLDTVDSLLEYFRTEVDPESLGSVREELVARRDQMTHGQSDFAERLQRFAEQLREARDRVENWKIEGRGFAAIEPGLLKTYGRGREAMAVAYDELTMENFHEWRKRVKYHWYHLRILNPIWKPAMNAVRREACRLAELLGDIHDLAVLKATVQQSPNAFGNQPDVEILFGMIDRRRVGFQQQGKWIGQRLFAERPQALGKRFGHYYKAWRKESKDTG